MPDYSKGKIYKLCSEQTNDIYIGSTTRSLKKRLGDHIGHYKCFLNGKDKYVTSSKLVKYDDCKIVLIENFPCITKRELHIREGYYQTKFKCVNLNIAGRDKKKYREDHKDYNRKKFRCECGGRYQRSKKSQHCKTKKHLEFNELIKTFVL